MDERWYWCLTHRRVEPAEAGPAHDRMGPYPTREAAARWKDNLQGREDLWQAQDDAAKDEWDREDEEWERR